MNASDKTPDIAQSPFFEWLKTDWPMKLGALFILLGFGWLITYAFVNNWVGPFGRIAFGMLLGLFTAILGEIRFKKFPVQGGIFVSLGATIAIISILAGESVYALYSASFALTLVLVVALLVSISSIVKNKKSLAILGFVLAAIAPMFVLTIGVHTVGLFSYLLVMTLGFLWLMYFTKWRELTLASMLTIAYYSMQYWVKPDIQDSGILLYFVSIFSVIFFIVSLFSMLGKGDEGKSVNLDFVTTTVNTFVLLIWIIDLVPDDFQVIFALVAAAVYIITTIGIGKATHMKLKKPMYIFTTLSIVMLGFAAILEFNGPELVVVLTLLAAVAVLLSVYLPEKLQYALPNSVVFFIPGIMSLSSVSSREWLETPWNSDFVVLAIFAVIMFILSYFFQRYKSASEESEVKHRLRNLYFVVGLVYAHILMWLALHSGIQAVDTANMVTLIVFTIISLLFYIPGRHAGSNLFAYSGVGILIFVILRLLFVEVWMMDLIGRIITFFIIGLLLISTAFMGLKKKS